MLSFTQFLTEAGIRRRQRVENAAFKKDLRVSTDPKSTPAQMAETENVAAQAETLVSLEQAARSRRVLKRAKKEAGIVNPLRRSPFEVFTRPASTGNLDPHETLKRIPGGEQAAEWASEMMDVTKPGFVRGDRRMVKLIRNAVKNPLDGVGSEGL